MNTRSLIAFWCYFVALIAPAAWGIMFLFRDEFMPYHAAAVSMPWGQVPETFQVLILALLKLVGAAWFTSAVAVLLLLLVPFRQGSKWARWAVPSLALLHYSGVFTAMTYVARNSPATPPWNFALAGAALVLAGASLSIPRRSDAQGRK